MIFGTGVSPQAITVLQDISSGFNDPNDNSLFIYPNPTKDDLNITNINAGTKISIYDLKGNMLIYKIATSTTCKIDISTLSRGFYTIRLIDDLMTQTSKFIKQ